MESPLSGWIRKALWWSAPTALAAPTGCQFEKVSLEGLKRDQQHEAANQIDCPVDEGCNFNLWFKRTYKSEVLQRETELEIMPFVESDLKFAGAALPGLRLTGLEFV